MIRGSNVLQFLWRALLVFSLLFGGVYVVDRVRTIIYVTPEIVQVYEYNSDESETVVEFVDMTSPGMPPLYLLVAANCTINGPIGHPLTINKTTPTWHELEAQVDCLPGGEWAPQSAVDVTTDDVKDAACISARFTAIIVPYRDRSSHLKVFLRHIHEYCQRQKIHYRIFIIQQIVGQTFNRAKLLNVGYIQAKRYGNFDCFVMHDVDLLPVVSGVPYSCSAEGPLHMVASMDKFQWRIPYHSYFGGVTAYSDAQFMLTNGMSNRFWGWGGEDDDAFFRVRYSKQKFQRVNNTLGRYSMFKHGRDKGNHPKHGDHSKMLRKSKYRWKTDGLSDLKYKLKEDRAMLFKTYTEITVDLLETQFANQKLKRFTP